MINRPIQHGSALLLILLLTSTVLATALLAAQQKHHYEAEREQKTQLALSRAKTALIAWSVARAEDSGTLVAESPGELPCPSPYAPGTPEEGQANPNNCQHGAIGLLPWRQLGSERLVDGWGQPLWYALDNAFKVRRNTNEIRLVNSDSRATLQVYAADGSTLLTQAGAKAAAVIFSAGPPLSGQNRAAYPAGTRITAAIQASFLDAAHGRNNATPGGPFMAGPIVLNRGTADEITVLNDRLLILSGRELLDALAPRIATAVHAALLAQKQESGHYPRPALLADPACRDNDPDTPCRPSSTACRGILPADVATGTWLPVWFRENQWHRAIYYALGSGDCAGSPINIAAAPGFPEMDNVPALFILPGTALGNRERLNLQPPAYSTSSQASLQLADYLEQNLSGWNPPDLMRFIRPADTSNDRLYALP